MQLSWEGLVAGLAKIAPPGSTSKKLLTIVSIILVFEGISVIFLFSYDAMAIGVLSISAGLLLLLLLTEKRGARTGVPRSEKPPRKKDETPTIGVRLMDKIVTLVGGSYILMAMGVGLIVFVVVFNLRLSANPKFGDLDTLSIMLGGMLLLYPTLSRYAKVESVFCLLFLGLVVVFLVVPQFVISISSRASSSLGGAYVHYMLAAPFAGILNLIGIPSSSTGNLVSITFQDGIQHWLTISSYCAGMYSFSIFVSAFIAFVLVFERLPAKTMGIVLGVGLLAAYLGNLFRMVIIGVVGYYRGMGALLWTHENVGWIIFLGWSTVFWFLVMRYAENRTRKGINNVH